MLFLGGNAVSRREGLGRLNGCPGLHVLTLHKTPLSLTKNYRHHVVNRLVNMLPSLMCYQSNTLLCRLSSLVPPSFFPPSLLPPPPSLLPSYAPSYSILSLRALDRHVISDEEIIENLHTNNSTYTPMTHHFQLQLHKHYSKVHPLSRYSECNLGRRRNGWGEGGMLGEKEECLGRGRNGWGVAVKARYCLKDLLCNG